MITEEELKLLRLEYGRKFFAKDCSFITGAAELHQLPVSTLPEISFAGRSNVGKSSIINALTGRKNLARTSNTPGRTQQINFFSLDNNLTIADLPGYGFAEAPKTEVAKWTNLVFTYLRGRSQLRRVYLLIDSRHGIKKNDEDVMDMLDIAAVNYHVILTKIDKIKETGLAIITEQTLSKLKKRPAAYPEIIATSSEKNVGIADLRAEIAAIVKEN